jgi:hypothetical protein
MTLRTQLYLISGIPTLGIILNSMVGWIHHRAILARFSSLEESFSGVQFSLETSAAGAEKPRDDSTSR